MSTTATQKKAVTFYSPHRNLTLVRIPVDEEIVRGGQRRKLPGVSYSFEKTPNFLTVYVGQDLIEDGVDPETGEWVKQDAVQWLRNHRLFGESQPGGFDEYREPVPPSSDTLTQVVDAMADEDLDRLSEIREHELSSHARSDVLDAVDRAIKKLED